MLEIPELFVLKEQMNKILVGKKVCEVLPPTKVHKFCWFINDPKDYEKQIKDCEITQVDCFGLFLEMSFSNNKKLSINDGVHPEYFADSKDAPKDYQCKMIFNDNSAMVYNVGMYGGIYLYDEKFDNDYYKSSKNAISPFDKKFDSYFDDLIKNAKPNLSAKAIIATEQRIPGIGNGVAQDILFNAGIHPKRKISTLSNVEMQNLKKSIVSTLKAMCEQGGRDTEKDLFGNTGGYKTILSKKTVGSACPQCSSTIVKETYLGGSIYFCPSCQKL